MYTSRKCIVSGRLPRLKQSQQVNGKFMVQVPPLIVMEIHGLLSEATKLWENLIKAQYQRYDEQYATEIVRSSTGKLK